jgi:class 3 adenylate cyclase/pimeloyl-ACP methyl ester carboxylesterase
VVLQSILPDDKLPAMPLVPETRFVRHGQVSIAYQELGRGAMDMLVITGAHFCVDLVWEHPGCARMLRQMAAFGRLIMFDLVGTGSSDTQRDPWELTLYERWAEEAAAVLDAVGSQRAVLVGVGELAPVALILAATHPDRTAGVIVINGCARFQRSESYPAGVPSDIVLRYREAQSWWGTGRNAAVLAPSASNDNDFPAMLGRWERLSMPPTDQRAAWLLVENCDVTPVLGLVRAPVLLLHRVANPFIRIGHARYLAAQLQEARLVELPGADHVFFVGDTQQMVTEIEQFVTGERHVGPSDRLLATVLFSDIAGSTELAGRLGDRAFAQLLDRHDEVTAQEVAHHRGRLVKSTGDGALARFDGPGRAIACAQAMQREIAEFGLELRCGLHTGEIEVRGDDIGGIAVHTAARIAALAAPGEILVSRTVTDLVAGSPLQFEDRGTHKLKGVPADWPLFAVVEDSLP